MVTALAVAGMRARGWRVAVITPRYTACPSRGVKQFVNDFGTPDLQVDIPSAPFPPYPDIRLAAPHYWRIAATVRDFRPDVVHCATEFMIGRFGQVAAIRAGVPLVSSYHTDFGRYAEAYGAPALRKFVSDYIARFHSRSLRTYTPSRMARADLLALGVRDVEVWGRTVDTRIFTPERRDPILRGLNGWDRKFVLLHVGRLAAEKGVHRILEAFRVARELLPARSVQLVIAGGGPEEATLRRLAPPDVTFLGVLDHRRDLPKLYASADAFVLTSLTETLGLVMLEAMASGIPVIATPAGGIGDHLRHEENGLAFAASDVRQMAHAMVRLAMDPKLRDQLALGARRTAEGLDWEGELDRLDVSYREVCVIHATHAEKRGVGGTRALGWSAAERRARVQPGAVGRPADSTGPVVISCGSDQSRHNPAYVSGLRSR
ncbi:MAG: glycosyltransferase family 1 protein [Gemmatimonadota bacterium]|nr:glycosyltransferase family 1 protein [Gemmatimonadota bacterium]